MNRKAALIILDGWGHGKNPEVSALAQADTPFVDGLYDKVPHAELVTYGLDVGLPEGQMGNSEVGHLNIGAGRIVYQDLAKINKAIEDDTLASNSVLVEGIQNAVKTNKRIHLMGLVSDGGVHAHINHLRALCDILADKDVEVYIHAFLDGRDTDPHGGAGYLQEVSNHIKGSNAKLASIVGRYYAMDRDNRWERVKIAYDLLVHGKGTFSDNPINTVKASYKEELTDEFMPPILCEKHGIIKDGDTVLFFNYRTDRPREITKVLTQEDMPDHDMCALNLHYMTMTAYDASFEGLHVLYEKDNLINTIGEVVAEAGLSQTRIAETEKYPHVTFFFSGGREEPFDKEMRIIAASPKVATYDLQPEMSAVEVTDKLIQNIEENHPDFICLNYANTDMVGHTGDFEAAKTAASTVDNCLSRLVPTMLENDYSIIIIADHGNSDIMKNPDGSPHTAHTTNMVPIFFVSKDEELKQKSIKDGKLADVAPTVLSIMNVDAPEEMTGDILLS